MTHNRTAAIITAAILLSAAITTQARAASTPPIADYGTAIQHSQRGRMIFTLIVTQPGYSAPIPPESITDDTPINILDDTPILDTIPTCEDPGNYSESGPHPCPQYHRNGTQAEQPAPIPDPTPTPPQSGQDDSEKGQ
jgi:hypothetical protein